MESSYDNLPPRRGLLGIRRKWVVLGILFSIVLHLLLIVIFNLTSLTRYGDPYFERLVPRTFKLERVEIDPKLLEATYDTPEVALQAPTKSAEVALPEEKTDFAELLQDIHVTPEAPPQDATRDLLQDKPSVENKSMQEALDRAAETARAAREMENAPVVEQIFRNQDAASDNRPLLEFSAADPNARAGDHAADQVAKGFSNLDAMLSQSAPVENQPILMDSGLLFGYDEYLLQPGSVPGLTKLGQLIARTPNARIVIEGHTDTFGSDEYNLILSRRRAESVKAWMVENLGIPAANIATVGYGKKRTLVEGDTQEAQQINRRVEILITRQVAAP